MPCLCHPGQSWLSGCCSPSLVAVTRVASVCCGQLPLPVIQLVCLETPGWEYGKDVGLGAQLQPWGFGVSSGTGKPFRELLACCHGCCFPPIM